MIKVLFIDIDNTLLSFTEYVKQTMREGLLHFDLPAYEDWMFTEFERINGGLWRQIEEGTLIFEELVKIRWNRIFDALGISFDGTVFEDYFREELFDNAIPEPGAGELLSYLSARYPLCAASNGPYEQQLNRLRVAGMQEHFTHFFISSRFGVSKPGKEYFDRCFSELHENGFPGLKPEEVMIIGDSITADIAGGKSYGLRTCLYTRGETSKKPVPEADFIVAELAEIREIL